MKQGNVLVSHSRYLGAAFAIALLLICPVWLSHAQQKRPAPPPPKPAPQTNPFGSFGEELKQKAAETTISTLLNNDLPLKLDANAVYPIVNVLPGGPFHSKHLQLTAEDMDKPLPPGDYTINTLATRWRFALKPGDQINMNDRIITGPNSRTEADFADGTQMILAGKTSLVVDSYAYDPTNPDTHPSILYRWLEGAFQWTSGKLGPPKSNERIETSHGTIGIRGTEFVAIMNSTGDATEIDLIDGQLDITPKVAKRETLFTAPVKIAVTATSATGAPLSQAEYEAAKGHLSPSQGSGVPTL